MASMPSNSSTAERVSARAQCEDLFLNFHRLIDEGHATQAVELFADDPAPRLEVRGVVHVGTEALAKFLHAREQDERRQTRHLASNFHFELLSDDRARATANLTLFHRGGDDGSALVLEAVVDCDLEFVRLGADDWRVTSRRHSRFATARY